MQPIELRSNKPLSRSPLVYFAIGLLGLINIRAIGFGACLCWVAVWSVIGFAAQKFLELQKKKFKITIDDSGIEFVDWAGVHRFKWNELTVEEVTIYRTKRSETGRSVRSHGGDPALAATKESGILMGMITSNLVFKNKKDEYKLPHVLDDGDYQDLVALLNVLVCSRSQSAITVGLMRGVGDLGRALKAAHQEPHAKELSIAAYEKLIPIYRESRSPHGFALLPILEGYRGALQKEGQIEKAATVDTEIDTIRKRIPQI